MAENKGKFGERWSHDTETAQGANTERLLDRSKNLLIIKHAFSRDHDRVELSHRQMKRICHVMNACDGIEDVQAVMKAMRHYVISLEQPICDVEIGGEACGECSVCLLAEIKKLLEAE